MRKWISYLIVVSIMISVITGCSIFGGSSGSSFGGIGGIGTGGGSGYSLAIGVLDTSFNPNGQFPGIVVHNNAAGGNSDDFGNSIYVDNNGNIYVTGSSHNGFNPDMVIWKYNSSGSLDSSFNRNGTTPGIVVHHNAAGGFAMDYGNSTYVDDTGNIYVTGSSWSSSRGYDMVIWKYNSNGSLDSSFNRDETTPGIVVHHNAADGNSHDGGNSIYVDNTGNIYVTGSSINRNGDYDMVIWRYNSSGSSDLIVVHHNAAGGDYEDAGSSIYVDNNGKIYVTGYSINSSNNYDMVIWKYNRDGSLDNSFNRNGATPGIVVHNNAAGGNSDDYGNSIYVDNTGKIYVTGRSRNNNGNFDMVIWRYNRDGDLDTSFNGTGFVVHDNAAGSYLNDSSDSGNSIYVDNTGRIYVTGYSTNSYGDSDMVIWRYNSNGSLDSSFGNNGIVVHHSAASGNGSDSGNSIYVDSTGKIYVTGYSYNGRNFDMVIWKYK
jgi:uncharacterized delta-60 repeat protein